ncbi:hypothetical protein [Proteus terrae]|uniref:hypothetical protein n=1 Tax=Proteus terrae TaxID=1574161 RepID=UPI0028729952|nr:hypothetical protein [Proteus terrae]MDR9740770.1 hypothetical protein [Proteus terrae]
MKKNQLPVALEDRPCASIRYELKPKALDKWLRYSSSDVQRLLRKYENSKEKFAVKMVLTRDEGSMFYYGSVETGMNIDGSVGQMMDSGISIKLSGRDYLNAKK